VEIHTSVFQISFKSNGDKESAGMKLFGRVNRPTEDMEIKVPFRKQYFDKNCLIFQVIPSILLRKREEERVNDPCLNIVLVLSKNH
jgi:hypothetical protein